MHGPLPLVRRGVRGGSAVKSFDQFKKIAWVCGLLGACSLFFGSAVEVSVQTRNYPFPPDWHQRRMCIF